VIDFIFMLTRHDRTVEDCLETADFIAEIGLKHIGFKDVGANLRTLRKLAGKIHNMGATSYLEVVSPEPETCLQSARLAADIGVDRLLGGTQAADMLRILDGSGIEYLPFPGRPQGHPTTLTGSPDEIYEDCRRFSQLGCAGVDLLAYRSTDADPLDLVRAAREGTDGDLVVAGSIDSPERIKAVREAGADAFTIGSAIFDGSFSKHKGLISSQLKEVFTACA